jgi:hypothetical protein
MARKLSATKLAAQARRAQIEQQATERLTEAQRTMIREVAVDQFNLVRIKQDEAGWFGDLIANMTEYAMTDGFAALVLAVRRQKAFERKNKYRHWTATLQLSSDMHGFPDPRFYRYDDTGEPIVLLDETDALWQLPGKWRALG